MWTTARRPSQEGGTETDRTDPWVRDRAAKSVDIVSPVAVVEVMGNLLVEDVACPRGERWGSVRESRRENAAGAKARRSAHTEAAARSAIAACEPSKKVKNPAKRRVKQVIRTFKSNPSDGMEIPWRLLSPP
jgi:hypothetical protein